MEVQYLTLMLETKQIFGITNEPVKEEDIIALQEKLDIMFPKAYQEFLFIGGNSSNMINSDHGFYHPLRDDLNYMEEIQERVSKFLKGEGLEIEGGDFWVICELDGGEQFHFFYFDDPDALDAENPPVYASFPAYLDEGLSLKKKIADTFSQYIDDKIKAYTKQ